MEEIKAGMESASREEGNFTDHVVYTRHEHSEVECAAVRIKEERDSRERENPSDSVSDSQSADIKEESDSYENMQTEGPSVRVKEEPEWRVIDNRNYTTGDATKIECTSFIKMEESVSCDDGNITGSYAPAEHTAGHIKEERDRGGNATECTNGDDIRIECTCAIKKEDGALTDVDAHALTEQSGCTSDCKEEPHFCKGGFEDIDVESSTGNAQKEETNRIQAHNSRTKIDDTMAAMTCHQLNHKQPNAGKGLVHGPAFQNPASDKSDIVDHQAADKDKKLSCSVCGKAFSFKADLAIHERIHTGEKPFACSDCGKCFSQKSNLVQHRMLHTGEKPFSCPDCGRRFARQWYLFTHQQTHTGEKPFSCSECGKSYTLNSQLVRHRRIHTGESLFPCSECGKTFTRRSILLGHLRMHTGEKPFSCEECGRRFTRRTNLLKHENTHKKEKSYICAECGKSFVRFGHLAKHQHTHTREKLS